MAFDGGTGVQGDPYLVSTAAQLDEVQNSLAAHYLQTADIDLAGYANWMPIGGSQDWDNYFTGTYDGGNFKISNLTIVRPTFYLAGLFGGIELSTLKNINLYNVHIIGRYQVGALVGYCRDSTVTDCHAYGGIVAAAEYGTVGGLIGDCWSRSTSVDTLIADCGAEVEVTSIYNADAGGSSDIGGFIGNFGTNYVPAPTMLLTRCYATGNVLTPEWTAESGTYSSNVGGFVGGTNATAVGAVIISECYATGDVRCDLTAGGFVGDMNKQTTIRDCYATGAVYGSMAAEATVSKLGGFVGLEYGFASAGYGLNTIERCYSAGPVCANGSAAAHTLIGAFVGEYLPLDSTIIKNSYYDSTTAQRTDVIAEGKTTAEMLQGATFVGWDFAETWLTTADANNGYPTFAYLIPPSVPYSHAVHYLKQNGEWVVVSDAETIPSATVLLGFADAVSALIDAALTASLQKNY